MIKRNYVMTYTFSEPEEDAKVFSGSLFFTLRSWFPMLSKELRNIIALEEKELQQQYKRDFGVILTGIFKL